jgi:hypothetical protein
MPSDANNVGELFDDLRQLLKLWRRLREVRQQWAWRG